MKKHLLAVAIISALAPMAAQAADAPKVSGLLQFDARATSADAGSALSYDGSVADSFSTRDFDMRRARVAVEGKASENVDYVFRIGADHGKFKLFDAAATINLMDLASVKVGQFKYAFDMQGYESSATNPFMDHAEATQKLAGGGNEYRDRGVELSGKLPVMKMGYAVGVYRGDGIDTDNRASAHDGMAYTANLHAEPMGGMKVNLGYLKADQTPSNTTTSAVEEEGKAYTAGVSYETGPVFLRTEFYKGETKSAGAEFKTKGWYAEGMYQVMPDLDLMARYQTFTFEDLADGDVSSIDLGAKYYLTHKGRRGGTNLAVNYMIRNVGDNVGADILNNGRSVVAFGADAENIAMARLQVQF